MMSYLGDVTKWKLWYPGADTSAYFFVEGKIKGITTGKNQSLVLKEMNDSSVLTTNAGPDSKEGESGWNIYPGHVPNSYAVQWYMGFHLRWYPWEKFSSLLLEKRYGRMMEQGLQNLKAQLEK